MVFASSSSSHRGKEREACRDLDALKENRNLNSPGNNNNKPLHYQKKKINTAWVDLNRQATKVAGNAAPGTPIEKLGENYVTKVFDQARDAGFNLVRIFGHGEETSFMLQTAPGQYDERIFKGLDYVIAVAGSRGIRVLFVPINMWLSPHVGDGFGTYVEWAGYPVSQSVSFFLLVFFTSLFFSDTKTLETLTFFFLAFLLSFSKTLPLSYRTSSGPTAASRAW